MNGRGFSLLELIVVMAIMGIVLAIGTLEFHTWQQKAQIERQTRELFTDLNAARTESVFRKKRHSITINSSANGYVFRRYSSENDTAGTAVGSGTFTSTVSKPTGASLADRRFDFDIRGMTDDEDSISFTPFNSGAAVDCIVISVGRANMGKTTNGKCVTN